MEKIPATVGILTFNNEATLERTLESVAMFDDILVCDGGSTDATLEIARRFGARVIPQDPRYKNPDNTLRDWGGVREGMLQAAHYDWYLSLDSDETISDGLREEIRTVAGTPLAGYSPLVYRVPVRCILDGREIMHASNYPGYQLRFFNRQSGARYIKPVHERILFDRTRVRVGTMRHPWYVYSTRDEAHHYLRETRGYRAMEIRMMMNRSWGDYLKNVVIRSVRSSLGALIKATRNYMRYGFRESAPVLQEIGRVLAPLALIWGVTSARISRKVRYLMSRDELTEPELKLLPKLLERNQFKAFIDVGANEGAYVKAALKKLPPAQIYAFEPNPTYIPKLHKKFPGVCVEQMALSANFGSARLKVPLINGVPYGTRSTLESYVDIGETGARFCEVTTTTLDTYCAEHELIVGTIKIDTEGHELAVIEGAKRVIAEDHPTLIIEIEQRRHERSISSIFSYICALGYDGYFYDALHACVSPISEFDVAHHQDMGAFKTHAYVNNFIFVPAGASPPMM